MAKQVDLGEKYDLEPVKPSQKHYPRMRMKAGLRPNQVGENVTLTVKAKVCGYTENDRGGAYYDVELRSAAPTDDQKAYSKSRRKAQR